MRQILRSWVSVGVVLCGAFGLAACTSLATKRVEPVNAVSILTAPSRFEGDAANDERRKAAEVLAFMAVRPGEVIFDIEAGGGYWTEILSLATGPSGKVILQNPEGFIPFIKETLDKRFAGGRLANVTQSISNFDALNAPDASVDLVTWVQGPHEVYYKPGGKSLGDPDKSWAEVARILKPGGRAIIIDHSALPGAPETTGNDLHRIDPTITLLIGEKAGLKFDARSDALVNHDDPKTKSAFDPSIRGKTDQHILRFVKPK